MEPTDEAAPAPYSHTDSDEIEALRVLTNAVDRNRVRLDIRMRDKYPNADGTIELVDADRRPIAKIDVQLRGTRNISSTYYCELELLGYASVTTLPFILILVDLRAEKVYWKQVSIGEVRRSKDGKGKLLAIPFRAFQEVTSAGAYLEHWLALGREYQRRIREFGRLEQALMITSGMVEPPIHLPRGKIEFCQRFVDSLNHCLDTNFAFLKELLFPGIWKIGVASDDDTKALHIALFGIPRGGNQALVQQIRWDAPAAYFQEYWTIETGKEPESVARQILAGYFKEVIEHRAVPLLAPPLANEYVYSAVFEYHYALGLEERESYKIEEIREACQVFLPSWLHAAAEAISMPSHIPYFDIDIARLFLTNDVLEKLRESAKPSTAQPIIFSAKNFNLLLLYECLALLGDSGEQSVQARVPLPDWQRVAGRVVYYDWECFDLATIRKCVVDFCCRAERVVDELCEQLNLPMAFRSARAEGHVLLIEPEIDSRFGIRVKTARLRRISSSGSSIDECIAVTDLEGTIGPRSAWNAIALQGSTFELRSWHNRIESNALSTRGLLDYVYEHLREKCAEFERGDQRK